MKRTITGIICTALFAMTLTGCGDKAPQSPAAAAPVATEYKWDFAMKNAGLSRGSMTVEPDLCAGLNLRDLAIMHGDYHTSIF